MENMINCDILTALLIDEATKKHHNWEIDTERYNILREKAKDLDNIPELDSIGLYINEDTLEVSFIIKCIAMQFTKNDSVFSIIKDSSYIKCYREDDDLVTEIVFENIWRYKNEQQASEETS